MTATVESVRKSVTVSASQERAFEVFAHEHTTWWPRDSHHISDAEHADAILEPREGGRWYERDENGAEREWGRVLVVERPRRILLAWQLSPKWEFDADPERATEVEVTFEPQGDAGTSVTLEHRGFEVHGDAAGAMREAIAGAGGWSQLLELYGATLGGWS